MSFWNKCKQSIRKLMQGRNGADELSFTLLIAALIFTLLSSMFPGIVFQLLSLVVYVLCIFRMFSRNIQARYAENEKFMRWWRPVSNRIRGAQGRFADRKTHCYFKCPECGQRLRVPKGKGKIMITCPQCHTKFDRKT